MFTKQLDFILFSLMMLFQTTSRADFLPSNVEYVFEGDQYEIDPELGIRAIPNSQQKTLKYIDGKLVSNSISTIDKNGLRVSSASHRIKKNKHLLLIDGSVMFGSGLNDDETISHWINLKSSKYEAYSIGLNGYQLPHDWLIFKKGDLPKKIRQKKGKAIIYINSGTVYGLAQRFQQLSYFKSWPFIKKNSEGQYHFAGLYQDHLKLSQKWLLKYCLPFNFCKSFIESRSYGWNFKKYLPHTIGLISSIRDMYRQQFDSEDFIVAWGDKEIANGKFIEEISDLKVFNWSKFSVQQDMHPSKEGAKSMADFLFDQKIIN